LASDLLLRLLRALNRHPAATPVALAAAALVMSIPRAWSQDAVPAPMQAASAASDALQQTVLEADEISGRPDLETVAKGNVELRRGGMTLSADRLSYSQPNDLARASGSVVLTHLGNRYAGRELQMVVDRFEGFFLEPTYFFARTQAGGTAQRLDFLGESRASAIGATYTSCPVDGSGDPAWILSTDRIRLDFDKNEGIAEGAVLRFYGVPILAAPILSFPLTDERKSGWLPPSIGVDTKTGVQVSVPYYWNIAPNRDATLTPTIITKRGFGLDTEFRYLTPTYEGKLDLSVLANDRLYGDTRGVVNYKHEGRPWQGAAYSAKAYRVSDDDYWKDFPGRTGYLTPRLLPVDLRAAQQFDSERFGEWTTYARVHRWQVLQDPTNLIDSPYDRAPQVGVRTRQPLAAGMQFDFETEVNRFTNPDGHVALTAPDRPIGNRFHALGSISRPWVTPGWSVIPKLSFNAASYSTEQMIGGTMVRDSTQRVIPTVSLDTSWVLERDAQLFGRAMRQTLEPRLLYVRTPYRDQAPLPNFDSAGKDFNFDSIYTENDFSGVDRVSDANQVTAGVTSRVIDAASGAEALRLGVAQRILFSDQRITSDGVPIRQRLSDLLLLGSTSIVPNWRFDAALQYNPDTERTTRSILGARWSPGPFKTINAIYRLKQGESEQLELGWQWPVYGPARGTSRAGECKGTWYSVGRINYSLLDSRITDSVLGVEYDAGCWIGRVVAKRLSTSQVEATTQIGFEIEFVGLSRLGTNPLRVLKDNIPGYRLLRDDPSTPVAR
jgi:LPS-assembly protein